MVAPLPRDLPQFTPRPALAVVVLGLAGFLVDLFVRPISTEGFLLILLAASPFLLELARSGRPADAISAKTGLESPPRTAPRAEGSSAPIPQERPRTAVPRPAAARPAPAPAERQPSAPPARTAPRPPQQADQARPGVQRPSAHPGQTEGANPREPAKLL